MAMMPVAQGRHHHRPVRGSHAKIANPTLSDSDRRWLLYFGLYFIAMTILQKIDHPGALVVMGILTGLLASATLRRLVRHPGDRRFTGVRPETAEEAAAAEEAIERVRNTPIQGTPLPRGVVPLAQDPRPLPSEMLKVPGTNIVMTKNQALVLALGVGITLLANYSGHRVAYAQKIQDDTERLLGINGRWNYYGRG